MSETANLVFEWIFVLNSVKRKFFHVSIVNDPTTLSMYWSIIKPFVYWKKAPIIPPLLVTNKLVTNFEEKANIFNDFFSRQYQATSSNDSTLPLTL